MDPIVVYGDGACSGNPGPGGWAFLIVDPSSGHVQEASGHEPHTTNNRMELTALREALKYLKSQFPNKSHVELYWDSSYVATGFNCWLFGWAKNGFLKSDGGAVSNQDLWSEIWELKKSLPPFKITQIPGHSSIPGNERVDELSVAESQKQPTKYFSGTLSGYPISYQDLLLAKQPNGKERSSSSLKYPAYLSLVDGVLERHLDWPSCQARVKGQSAKFKKVKNSLEEQLTQKSWGLIKP